MSVFCLIQALKLSSAGRRQTTIGEIVNLMAVDSQRLQDVPLYFTAVWTTPVLLIITTGRLWYSIGPASMGGIALMVVILIPINGVYVANKIKQLQVCRKLSPILNNYAIAGFSPSSDFFNSRIRFCLHLQIHQMKLKDERVKIANEVLSGIKVWSRYLKWNSTAQGHRFHNLYISKYCQWIYIIIQVLKLYGWEPSFQGKIEGKFVSK